MINCLYFLLIKYQLLYTITSLLLLFFLSNKKCIFDSLYFWFQNSHEFRTLTFMKDFCRYLCCHLLITRGKAGILLANLTLCLSQARICIFISKFQSFLCSIIDKSLSWKLMFQIHGNFEIKSIKSRRYIFYLIKKKKEAN
jgi:hypothetical protein